QPLAQLLEVGGLAGLGRPVIDDAHDDAVGAAIDERHVRRGPRRSRSTAAMATRYVARHQALTSSQPSTLGGCVRSRYWRPWQVGGLTCATGGSRGRSARAGPAGF